MVKNLPAKQEKQVQSIPGQAGSREKEMTTYSSVLAWEIPWTMQPGGLQATDWTMQPGGLQATDCKRVRHDLATKQQQVI